MVISTLLESDAFPAGMELFPATDHDSWTLIQQVIDDSDYYVLVVGGKYGSLDEVEDVSFTEKEYDYALAAGKPVLAFLHGDPERLTVEKSEKSEEMQERLQKFRDKVQRSKHVKYWSSSEQLQGQVAVSYNRIVRQSPAIGWLRADLASSPQTLAELATARARIAELERSIEDLRHAPPAGSEDLSQGDDKFNIPVLVSGSVKNPSGTRINAAVWVRHTASWNEIFGVIAPAMLIEAEATAIREALDTWLGQQMYDKARAALKGEARGQDPSISNDAIVGQVTTEVDDEDFGTIMLQLKATGLVEESKRKRSVSDNGIYWTLTPLGEQSAVRVRAIRRTPGREATIGSEEGTDPAPTGD